MSEQLPAIIVLAPMFGSLLIALVGIKEHRVCLPIVVVSILASLVSTIAVAQQVFTSGPIDYFMGGWEEPIGIGIHLRVDELNALILVVIGIVALLVALFSVGRMDRESEGKAPQFYILYLLLCTGLFGITITADAFNLFVLIEVSSLTSYGLVAMGSNRRGTHAAFNYVIMGTVGASFYLIGVGYLYMKTGSLNMIDIRNVLNNNAAIAESNAIIISFLFILVGIWIKMAFFPLNGWLPNAYSYCPSTSACILAPLMTKVSVYVMIRAMLTIFGFDWIFSHPFWSDLVVWLAVIAILAGSIFALAQREIKKMLSYLIVAEVGYMVGGTWLGDSGGWGVTGAIYHILADAMMALCLFIAAGIFARSFNATHISDLEGLFKKSPWVAAGFVIGALAMIGVPPTCGFFSKFYLIRGGIDAGHWEYVAALLISSLVNAILFFRIFEIAHFGNKPSEGHDHHAEEVTQIKAAWSSTAPLLLSAAAIILLGLFNGQIIELIRVAVEDIPSLTANLKL